MKKILLLLATALAFAVPAWAAVDINNASQAELETISGVGPKKAQAIIEYRKKNGPFKSADDLDKVPGFGKKTVDALKKEITVGNPKAAGSGKIADRKTVREPQETMEVGNETAAGKGKAAAEKVVKAEKPTGGNTSAKESKGKGGKK